MINQNSLAKRIALREGGKENLSIAQIKEVLRLTLEELCKEKPSEVLALIESHECSNGPRDPQAAG